ncbi:thiol-activated cytolysin family protein [Ferruginibacter profundus]
MNNKFVLLAGSALLLVSFSIKAQVMSAKKLIPATGATTAISKQPIKKDTLPVAKPATGVKLAGQGNAPLASKPLQPANQLPARDLKQTDYGNKYNSPNQSIKANEVISGIYTQTIRSGGVPVTIQYKLADKSYGVSANTIAGAEKGKPGYMSKNKTQSQNNEWNCSSEQIRVSISNDSYMKINYEAQAANIWPGAVYKFNNFINSRSDETGNRNPVIISTSNPNISGSVSETMQEPNLVSARQAIKNLYERFTRVPEDISLGSMQIHSEEVRSAAELDIKIGASGYGGGFSASNQFNFYKKNQSHIFLFDCTKEMFSIDAGKPAGGFFTDPARETADMMYISSVTYGQRVMALVEISLDDEKITNNLKARYEGLLAGGSGAIDIASDISNGKATVNMFVVGGQSAKAYPAFGITEMKTRLQQIIQSLTYTTSKPIRYTFRNMNGDIVKYSSTTDYFNSISCEPKSEDEKPASVNVKIASIHIDQMNQDDVDLYGLIFAEVNDAEGNRIWEGQSKIMMSLSQQDHIRKEELKTYNQQNLPLKEIQINIPAGKVPGAKLTVYYSLSDYDSGSGDDRIKIRGQDGTIKGYDFQVIDLDPIKRGDQKRFATQFVDEDGDYPFTITIDVKKQ